MTGVVPDARLPASVTTYAHDGSAPIATGTPPLLPPRCGPPAPPRKKKFPAVNAPLGIADRRRARERGRRMHLAVVVRDRDVERAQMRMIDRVEDVSVRRSGQRVARVRAQLLEVEPRRSPASCRGSRSRGGRPAVRRACVASRTSNASLYRRIGSFSVVRQRPPRVGLRQPARQLRRMRRRDLRRVQHEQVERADEVRVVDVDHGGRARRVVHRHRHRHGPAA